MLRDDSLLQGLLSANGRIGALCCAGEESGRVFPEFSTSISFATAVAGSILTVVGLLFIPAIEFNHEFIYSLIKVRKDINISD